MNRERRHRRIRTLAAGLGVLVVAEVVAGWVIASAINWSWQIAYESFVVTNSAMALSFAICGSIIAFNRPRNAVGWLFIADGLGHGTTALMAPLMDALQEADAPVDLQRLAVTAFEYAWPWSIALFMPLSLMLLPDGKPVTPRWRPVIWALVATAPVFVLSMGGEAVPLSPEGAIGYFKLPFYENLNGLWLFAEVRTVGFMLLSLLSLFVRYRQSEETVRRQLLWVMAGTVAATVFLVPWSFVSGTPIAVLLAIPLIPVSVTIGILRHHLLDIRLVVSRALAFVLLSGVTVVAYVGLVALLDQFVSARFGGSAVATALLIVFMSPLLPRVQRLVDRAMYGDRGDPAKSPPGWERSFSPIRAASLGE